MTIVPDISVVVVDDHALFAGALHARLAQEVDLRPVLVAYGEHRQRLRRLVAGSAIGGARLRSGGINAA